MNFNLGKIKSFHLLSRILVIFSLIVAFSSNCIAAESESRIDSLSAENIIVDTAFLTEVANTYLPLIEEKLGQKASFESLSEVKKRIRQSAYLVARSNAFMKTAANQVLVKHPDVLIFRIGFEIALAAASFQLGVAGHMVLAGAVHFPGIGFGATALYYMSNQWWVKRQKSKEHGVSMAQIDQLKARIYAEETLRTIRLHILSEEDGGHQVFVARKAIPSRKRDRLSNEYILVSELETILSNPDFINEARKLSLDPALYEDLLIQKILSVPTTKVEFLERLKDMSRRSHSEWELWIMASDAFLARAQVEALKQDFAVKELYAPGRNQFRANYSFANRERKKLRKRIVEIEEQQIKTIASYIRGEEIDFSSISRDFETQRQSLMAGFSSYNEAYPNFVRSCQFLFAN